MSNRRTALGGRPLERGQPLGLEGPLPLAPVAGFGWLIATMGLAQCRPHQRSLRAAYVAVFILILMYSEVPWAGVLADWTAR